MTLLIQAFEGGAPTPNLSRFIGGLAVGWGLFNVVEGVIDHHILGIHHVRYEGSDALPWDLGFLIFGGLLILGGWMLMRRSYAR